MEDVEINPALDAAPVILALPAESRPRFSVARKWVPLLLKFASIQALVQVIGFAAGILVVRNLSKPQYALFTLGNTMLSTILFLADSGISSALTAIGGRVWQDSTRLSQLMKTALELRRQLLIVVLPVIIPLLVWLLHQDGATRWSVFNIVAIVLLGCSLELVTRIYSVSLRLKSEVRQIQNQALVAAAVKFAIIAAALAIRLNVEVALVSVAAGYAAQYWMLRRWHTRNLDRHAQRDPEMRSEIVSVVKRQAPHAIYYCLQSQVTVWLIGIFGSANGVAEVGALSRLAMVFTILASVTSDLVFPAFARLHSPAVLRRRYFQIIAAFCALSACLVLLIAIFPHQVLSVLGKQYQNLASEGILMAVSTVLGALAGLTWGLNGSRAWIIPPAVFIPVMMVVQVTLILVLNMGTVRGVLWFSIFTGIPSVLWAVIFGLRRIHSMEAAA